MATPSSSPTTKTPKKRGKAKTAASLADACKSLQRDLVADLRRVLADREHAADLARFKQEHADAAKQKRTAHPWSTWLTDRLEQIAASWVLGLVFIRYAEDTRLIEPVLSGPLDEDPSRSRHRLANEAYERYYREHPTHAEPEYLAHLLREASRLPGLAEILGEQQALLWQLWPSLEGARMLREFFRAIDDVTGQVRWRFDRQAEADELNGPDTRFLGDLYQDLSEHAKKTFALLQTPDFIEKFILDRTLDPAMKTFAEALRRGEFRMIDPTCGSGHFLLGGFQRLLRHWNQAAPGLDAKDRVQKALDGVWGCDLNPFAVAIARFRLLVAALHACGITRLKDAPNFTIQLAVGDALLHGRRFSATRGTAMSLPGMAESESGRLLEHLYTHEDRHAIDVVLSQQYHAVVGNPPYITPKDRALNILYRDRYGSCSGQYALSVPFMERFVELAVRGEGGSPAGCVGKITSNSFMKREFGTVLIESFFPRWELTTLIDTSGAYIPGHGTPTVILFLRNQEPSGRKVRSVLGIRGEPETPADPAQGLVWQAILEQIDQPGSEGEFVSVEDRESRVFAKHPWSVTGGGSGGLIVRLTESRTRSLASVAVAIGRTAHTGEDEAFLRPRGFRSGAVRGGAELTPMVVEGDCVRDWSIEPRSQSVFPYSEDVDSACLASEDIQALWPIRTRLVTQRDFGQVRRERALAWFEYSMFFADRYRTPRSIAFAFVATHNHFVFDRGGKVFKQSAPVIKLPPDATDEDHFALLGVLNSSTVAFWGRQVMFSKGSTVDARGARQATVPFEDFLEWSGTNVGECPVPPDSAAVGPVAKALDEFARSSQSCCTAAIDACSVYSEKEQRRLSRMIALQEELDWLVYRLYGLTDDASLEWPDLDTLPPIQKGERAFEIVMARKMAAGTLKTRWFERHGSMPITEVPSHWPAAYRELVERRIARIERDRDIRLIEQPECKRRWNHEPWEQQYDRTLRDALLDRIEQLPCWRDSDPRPRTTNEIADLLAGDARFMELLRLRTGEDAPNLPRAVAALVADECVPFLPGLYLKASGLRKRSDWEGCWRLQRLEDPFLAKQDALLEGFFGSSPAEQRRAREHVACWLTSEKLTKEKLGDLSLADREAHLSRLAALRDEWRSIDEVRQQVVGGVTPPVPPEYKSADFQQASFWKHRGKLDVAKERFVSYPGLSPDADGSLLVGWAGWNHLERAKALNAVIGDRIRDGWSGERLLPPLKGVLELLPWLRQWHGQEPEGDYGEAYAAYLAKRLGEAGTTERELAAWQPTVAKGRGRRAKAEAIAEDDETLDFGDRDGDEEDGDDA